MRGTATTFTLAMATSLAGVPDSDAVEFEVPNAAFILPPTAVCIAGDFNGWDETAFSLQPRGATHAGALELPDGGYQYRFVVTDANGTYWIADPEHPEYIISDGNINTLRQRP